MVGRKAALLLALLTLPLLRTAAQDAAASEPAVEEPAAEEPAVGEQTRRLLLCFELASDSNFTQEEELLLYESLLVQLGSASRRLALLEAPDRKPIPSNSDRSTLARSLGGDSWLLVSLSGDWTSVNLAAASYDLLTAQTVFAFQTRKSLLRGAADLERGFWAEVLEAAAEYYSQAAASKSLPGQVVFQARPGTRIDVVGRERLRADPSGQASLSVQLPLTLAIRARHAGFYPLEGKYYVSQELTTIPLQQARGARLAFDLYLNNAIFPGFEFSWFPLPSTVFLRTGFTTYLGGLYFSGSGEEEESIFVSRSLNLLDLAAGAYLNQADRNLRYYAGLGAFLRLITAEGYFGIEPIAPWGLQAILGLEYSRKLKLRFYLEMDPLLYYTRHADLLVASLPSDQRAPGYVFFDTGALHLLNLRFGIRWQI